MPFKSLLRMASSEDSTIEANSICDRLVPETLGADLAGGPATAAAFACFAASSVLGLDSERLAFRGVRLDASISGLQYLSPKTQLDYTKSCLQRRRAARQLGQGLLASYPSVLATGSVGVGCDFSNRSRCCSCLLPSVPRHKMTASMGR